MGKIKIGFIIPKYRSLQTKYTYGLEQNTYYLVSLFRSIPEYDISYVLCEENSLEESLENQKKLNDDTPLVEQKDLERNLTNHLDYDILIQVESYLPTPLIKAIKAKYPTKIVSFHAGIPMWGLMEDIVFNRESRVAGVLSLWALEVMDEIWISPHHAYHQAYIETFTKSPVTIIPYLYEPWFLQKLEQERRKTRADFSPRYNLLTTKHIGILEPNINLVKTSLIPMMIIESLYCQDSTIFDQRFARVYCSDQIRKHQSFKSMFSALRSKSVFTSESRYPIIDILNADCDCIVSHQHLCELNYLYLDALYYGIPLVHNSSMMQEYGYYYPDFDVKQGAAALKRALEQHDENLDEYKASAEQALYQFSTTNPVNINAYKMIIEKLLAR